MYGNFNTNRDLMMQEKPHRNRKYIDQTVRISTPFTEEELMRIDDYGFGKRIRERSAVIRELVFAALTVAKNEKTDQARQG